MNQKSITIILLVVAIVIGGMFMFVLSKKKELQSDSKTPPSKEDVTTTPYDYIERIDAKHFIDGEKHTLVGEIVLPTPCDLLNVVPEVDKVIKTVSINFNIVNSTKVCAQDMTPQKFQTSFNANFNPQFNSSINQWKNGYSKSYPCRKRRITT